MSHARTTFAIVLIALLGSGPARPAVVEPSPQAVTVPAPQAEPAPAARWALADELPGCDAVADDGVHRPGEADCPRRVELPGATVFSDDRDRVAEVRSALDRFAAAGLELPHIDIWLVPSEGCDQIGDGDMPAGFTRNLDSGSGVFSCGTEFTLLHELGHVWDHHALDDADRARFLKARDLAEWHTAWHQSGAEHLADVIAWGLASDHRRPSRTLPNDDQSLQDAFALIAELAG